MRDCLKIPPICIHILSITYYYQLSIMYVQVKNASKDLLDLSGVFNP